MKTIPLSQHPEAKEVSTRSLLHAAVSNMPQNEQGQALGFSLDEMETRLKLRALIKNLPSDATEIQFEDADFNYIKTRLLPAMRWTVLDEFIVEFGKLFK